jgi:hypothetical protein
MTKQLKLASLFVWMLVVSSLAHAGVTLFLEEPYSYDGAFAGTGHAAVYLSRVCAEASLTLRRCAPGESGVVLSRYQGIAGHDWIATPLIPYLYAVDKPEGVPLSADTRLADFLRDQYRRSQLESLAPDDSEGRAPTGHWVETVGVAYRRTIYAFQIDTTEEQDDELIHNYNSAPNHTRFNVVAHNCADFVRNLINFYYPKAIHRGVISDLGVTTPKGIAKSLMRFGDRHPELHLSTYVIPQVPGSIRRSRPVHGIVEAAFSAKKYMLPLLAFHPVMAGCFLVAGLGVEHVNLARNALVFDPGRNLEPPLAPAQRRLYQARLDSLRRMTAEENPTSGNTWRQVNATAVPHLDDDGQPVLQVKVGDETSDIGLSRNNILNTSAPLELAQQVLVIRLEEELKNGGPPKVSEHDVENDWELLQQLVLARRGRTDEMEARLTVTHSQ